MAGSVDIQTSWLLFKQIYNDETVLNAVKDQIVKHQKEVVKNSKFLLSGKWRKLASKSPLLILSAVAICLKTVYDRFIKMGFSESIFYDTMSDIKIWGEDFRLHHNGEVGLTEINWLRLHIGCQIFKLGRLQYQIGRFHFAKSVNCEGKTIKLGDKCYYIHIPRGERLDKESCKKSFALALDILPDIFKDIQSDIMFCHSWLLSPKNQNFVAQNSNIAEFAKLFNVIVEDDDASQHFRWVFDIEAKNSQLKKNKKKMGYYLDLNNFEPKSSLQSAAKDYVMNGGEFSCGKCYVAIKK